MKTQQKQHQRREHAVDHQVEKKKLVGEQQGQDEQPVVDVHGPQQRIEAQAHNELVLVLFTGAGGQQGADNAQNPADFGEKIVRGRGAVLAQHRMRQHKRWQLEAQPGGVPLEVPRQQAQHGPGGEKHPAHGLVAVRKQKTGMHSREGLSTLQL
ncbi:hypothetical protein DLM85_16795 [Hymenobacter edaphi]|uniref:Uncharacterized protein n=1 Tax=Hymenobacter edaphi TaxID=2211146 RepID=A0A328BET9_9BACT|nr:hypothetical protein DLM85_16795 [Hymenobacter edaphi]